MPNTRYAKELAKARVIDPPSGEEGRIERILVKAKGVEEIRFSWWTNNVFRARPLDLPVEELVVLLARGMVVQPGETEAVLPPTFLDQVAVAVASKA